MAYLSYIGIEGLSFLVSQSLEIVLLKVVEANYLIFKSAFTLLINSIKIIVKFGADPYYSRKSVPSLINY